MVLQAVEAAHFFVINGPQKNTPDMNKATVGEIC